MNKKIELFEKQRKEYEKTISFFRSKIKEVTNFSKRQNYTRFKNAVVRELSIVDRKIKEEKENVKK